MMIHLLIEKHTYQLRILQFLLPRIIILTKKISNDN